jgi:hypothetical protein
MHQRHIGLTAFSTNGGHRQFFGPVDMHNKDLSGWKGSLSSMAFDSNHYGHRLDIKSMDSQT